MSWLMSLADLLVRKGSLIIARDGRASCIAGGIDFVLTIARLQKYCLTTANYRT